MSFSDFQHALLRPDDILLGHRQFRVGRTQDLLSLAIEAGGTQSEQVAKRWIGAAVDAGILVRLWQGVYLNASAGARPEEAVTLLHPQAVVSCSTVLAKAGVVNPTNDIHLLVPRSSSGDLAGRSLRPLSRAVFKIHRIKDDAHAILHADTEAVSGGYPVRELYRQSSPEGALAAVMYIGKQARNRKPTWVWGEYDKDYLDMPRLERLAGELGLQAQLTHFHGMVDKGTCEEHSTGYASPSP